VHCINKIIFYKKCKPHLLGKGLGTKSLVVGKIIPGCNTQKVAITMVGTAICIIAVYGALFRDVELSRLWTSVTVEFVIYCKVSNYMVKI